MVIQKPVTIDVIRTELKNLDSKVELLQERLTTIENTQDVIGRTIINVNQKIKDLEQKLENHSPATAENNTPDSQEVQKIREELKKLKYTIEMINPLEFATITQVKELLKDLKEKPGLNKPQDKAPKEISFT